MLPLLKQSTAWNSLQQHYEQQKNKNISDFILSDLQRLSNCQIALKGLRFNYALNSVTAETIGLLMKLADERMLSDSRARLFKGDKINISENRAALHTALRQKNDAPVLVDGRDVLPNIRSMQAKMAKLVQAIRDGEWKGSTGKPIHHVVNIGIGGSDLGPRLAVDALTSFSDKIQVHFVANVDAADLLLKLKHLDPQETLFVIVSKTFTTQETLLNACTARVWLTKQLGEGAVKKHFFAVSSNVSLCEVFGIHPDCILPMWDWVGGRFSLWSAVGFSIAIAIGMDHFKELLNGASSMDEHFLTAPNDKNIPVLLALLGIWNGTLAGIRVQVVLPYADALRELPRYLQQLEMESNGKSVTREAAFVDTLTVPVLFGEPGTIGQHSFYQWLHQGSDRVMADFIGVVQDDYHLPEHHQALLANMVAQSTALAFGKRDVELLNNVYLGNKPCNLIMLDKLDPYSLGMLLALYEHKVFVQSIIWNINPFDQPGVELGKVLANKLLVETEHAVPADRFMQQFYNIISKSSGE